MFTLTRERSQVGREIGLFGLEKSGNVPNYHLRPFKWFSYPKRTVDVAQVSVNILAITPSPSCDDQKFFLATTHGALAANPDGLRM